MGKTIFTAEPGKQEVVVERTFDAPREKVFAAATSPDLISQWWGPARYKTEVDVMDVRPGGQWRYIHKDDDGNEFAFHGVYHTVMAPELVIDTFEFEGLPEPGHVILETARFTENNGKTTLRVTSTFQTLEDRDGMVGAGMEGGLTESHDRLAKLVETN